MVTNFFKVGAYHVLSSTRSVFTGQEFTNFVNSNGINHIKTALYHPSNNGLSERAVQVLKKGLSLANQGTLTYRLTSVVQLTDYTAFHNRNITCRIINGSQIKVHPNLEQMVHIKTMATEIFLQGQLE